MDEQSIITVQPEIVDSAQIVPAPEPEIVRMPIAPPAVPPEERTVDLDLGNGWHVRLDGYTWQAVHPQLGHTGRYMNREGAERAIDWGNYANEAGHME